MEYDTRVIESLLELGSIWSHLNQPDFGILSGYLQAVRGNYDYYLFQCDSVGIFLEGDRVLIEKNISYYDREGVFF